MGRGSTAAFVALNVVLVVVSLLAISLAAWDWPSQAGGSASADDSRRVPASVNFDGLWDVAVAGGFADNCTADMSFVYPISFDFAIGTGTFQCQGGASGSVQGTFTETNGGRDVDLTVSPQGGADVVVEAQGELSAEGDWYDGDWSAPGLGLSGNSLGVIEGAMPVVHFIGTVVTIGEDQGPDGWWNVEVTHVLSGPPISGSVDVYGVDRFGCYGDFAIPHDGSSIGRVVEVLGYYDAPHEVLPCAFDHYILYGTAPTVTSTPTSTSAALIQGDLDCSGLVDGVDVVYLLLYLAERAAQQPVGCPEIGSDVASLFGDMDCDDHVNIVDLQQLLRYAGGLSVTQQTPCPDIGTPLT